MSQQSRNSPALESFRRDLAAEYDRRFPASRRHHERYEAVVLDGTSHAIRWNDPFMPVVREAHGSRVVDLDGNTLVDYWQGHMSNLLGHNPVLIREALVATLETGAGLQTGMLHEVEGEVSELICRQTGTQSVRLTTAGSLGTFYAAVLARAFTGRDLVLKVAGGWHGSQPFGLKGVSAQGSSFDHLESEGLSGSTTEEIVLTRFNDVDDLRQVFSAAGDRVACLLIEPMLGAGGGMVASREYFKEARRLTEHHGALLVCDEIITGFRFRAGDLSRAYGIRPDLLVLGKIIGGGMPVSAVAGRRDVLELASRKSGRVRFEGGTYSAHELSLIAARTLLRHVAENEREVYSSLGAAGEQLRAGILDVASGCGVPLHVLGAAEAAPFGSSLVFVSVAAGESAAPSDPEEKARIRHPFIDGGLLKSVLILEGVSGRAGLGSVSTAHSAADLAGTVSGFGAGLARLSHLV